MFNVTREILSMVMIIMEQQFVIDNFNLFPQKLTLLISIIIIRLYKQWNVHHFEMTISKSIKNRASFIFNSTPKTSKVPKSIGIGMHRNKTSVSQLSTRPSVQNVDNFTVDLLPNLLSQIFILIHGVSTAHFLLLVPILCPCGWIPFKLGLT